MKRRLFLLFIFISIVLQAQDFKPYKIKSGKIVYKKLKYATHSVFKSKDGIDTSFSEQIPYVTETTNFYWDDFGDKAFEETYQVSKFGGEKLPKKVKIGEQLWIGEHRYYFDVKKNKMYDDPYYLRMKCKNQFQYYQIVGSWIKTEYMGVKEQGTKNILGKKATYYKIDSSTDLYAWKDLILKREDFATTRNGERLNSDRTKIAVKIDTISKINKAIFNPIWLKREKRYKSLNANKINNLIDEHSSLLKSASKKRGIKVKKNYILFFVTTKQNIGKIQVLNVEKNKSIRVKYELFYKDNIQTEVKNNFKIETNTIIDIERNELVDTTSKDLDFKYDNSKFIPLNNCKIYLLKSSRNNKYKKL